MPRHFGGRAPGIAKFTSFTRKLNRWGFKRVARGKEMGAYYHDEFRRGDADACAAMRPLHGGVIGAMVTASAAGDAYSEDDEDDDEKKEDNAREDEATNTINKEDVPVEEALGRGDEMPPPSSRSTNRQPSKLVQPLFSLAREGALQQNLLSSSVQLSPTQHQLQQLALLQHQQKVLQQQQQLMQQQPLAHVLSMKSTS